MPAPKPAPAARPLRRVLFQLGFRPFFLLAGVFATLAVAVWGGLYFQPAAAAGLPLAPPLWHAHEMVFGYTLAVIAGFLLTAVRNWTGVDTWHGRPLLVLALLWLGARAAAMVPHPAALGAMALLDLAFNLALVAAVVQPVVKARQWQQSGIVAMPALLTVAHALFYLGAFGLLAAGPTLGLHLGLYLVVLLILVMSRRVVPFFIERGVEGPVQLTTRPWLELAVVGAMVAFLLVETLRLSPALAGSLALLLFALQALRLYDWHTPALWRKPLLWSLYLALVWIAVGFALKAASVFAAVHPSLALHALAYGGIGLITLSMMSRVALGHTGRDVARPPRIVGWLFAALIAGAVVRVLLPLAWPEFYGLWIGLSQVLWIVAFGLFTATYAPMLLQPRIDGRPG
ncbi:NnrS family protein [Ectothiorhodospiraceae bacterium 2226]|nr:NnrS family protein [Ectothiorhodospiraceae bacterium 2226]